MANTSADRERGRRIRAARVAAEKTITDVARHLGFNRANVYHVEAGRQSLSAYRLLEFAQLVGADAEFLLTGKKRRAA